VIFGQLPADMRWNVRIRVSTVVADHPAWHALGPGAFLL